jgi:alkaline phosphatase
MSLTISSVRDAAQTRLATITGLRTYDLIPDTVNVPAAVVGNLELTWDEAMVRGLDFATFDVLLIASRMSDRSAQDKLDVYLAGTGASSVKTVLEGGTPAGTLNGTVSTVRVTRALPISITVASIEYLAYRYEVEVYG